MLLDSEVPRTCLALLVGVAACACGDSAPVVFSAMGDVPYTAEDAVRLRLDIEEHNRSSAASFMVHLGDIKSGSAPCSETTYAEVAADLRMLAVPTFMLVGDNEWNDCADPDAAWALWQTYFARFDEHWPERGVVERQAIRDENFAWLEDGVLMIGLNLVDGTVHDAAEWAARMVQNADWVDDQFAALGPSSYATVVLAHAGPGENRTAFFDRFERAADAYGRPVLYLQGNGHTWILDRPFPGIDVTRVQVDEGGSAPPLEITVTPGVAEPFAFERDPLR